MKNIKQQFQEFKTSTPKSVQWLLLAAAFIVVIILLTLILGGKSNNEKSVANADISVDFKVEPLQIDLTDVKVDSYKNATVKISVNTPVVIQEIKTPISEITPTHNCDGLTDNCTVNIIYKPTSVQDKTDTNLTIAWYIESQSDIINTNEVSITYSSWQEEKKQEPVVEPVVIEEPTPEPVEEPEPIEEPAPVEEPEPTSSSAADEIREISNPNPFKEPEVEEPTLAPEKCSDFAIPGYDQSGKQIGWIKPERGANYFHPFSDTDCSNPTGKYDFNTGIITSLEDGSKIGTDSDHIGYRNIRTRNISAPQLSSPENVSKSTWKYADASFEVTGSGTTKRLSDDWDNTIDDKKFLGSADAESVVSSRPYDRTFILRQFKPIPATIVSEVRADPSVYGCDKAGNCDPEKNHSLPVRATVDRNVYSDDGRTIILPTGTLLMGYLDGNLPGPYQAFGRMNIKWYQFIRPDGVEFNFPEGGASDPYSADAQGRMGVPGHGSTDYVEQMVMPIVTALVPAAVNMIAPITDTVINQIDLDNNTVVQSGTIRSSEMAKQDIINTWNKITQKLLVDAIDNTVPPFSIAAGTRINVFSPVDLIVTCGKEENPNKKCAFVAYNDTNPRRTWSSLKAEVQTDPNDASWKGQIRSFDLNKYCIFDENAGKVTINNTTNWGESGYDYRTVLAYCESQNYQSKNMAKQNAYNQQVQNQAQQKRTEYGAEWDNTTGNWTTNFSGNADAERAYNEEVLGLTYDDEGNIINPFNAPSASVQEEVITCEDGSAPDMNGCCAGETYTDMGEAGFNCCPDAGGDCFPPIVVE